MTDFWQQLLGTLAGNTLLTVLAGYLGKIYIDRIARKEQAAIDSKAREHTTALEERLKKLEQEHEKLLVKDEHFHQISQVTYQRLFEMKIDTYRELNKLKLEYKVPIAYDTDQIDYKGIDNRDFLNFKKFQKIIAYIDSKALYITPNLHEQANNFKSNSAEIIHDIEDWITFHSGEVSNSDDALDIDKYQAKKYSKLYEDTEELRTKVIRQIDDDILKISRYIHGSTL